MKIDDRNISSNHDPNVTVLLTVYNGMPYLEEAVQSILQQDYSSFIFLIINNASVDSSKKYLDSINDPRMQVLHLDTTLSRSEVLNYGLFQIKTKYTAIIDADDIANPKRLSKQISFLETHNKIVLLGSAVKFIDIYGKTRFNEVFPKDHQTLVDYLVVNNCFMHSACMYRTQAAVEAGGYPKKFTFAQDFGLWIAMIRNGGYVACLKDNLASIRQHPNQLTRKKNLKLERKKEKKMLMDEIMALPNLSPYAKHLISIRTGIMLMNQGRVVKGSLKAILGIKDARLLVFPMFFRYLASKVRPNIPN